MSGDPGHHDPCGRPQTSGETRVADAGLNEDERVILTIARYYFKSFANPHDYTWMRAIDTARLKFGEAKGAQIAAATLDMVREMRLARRSMFRFSNPDCPKCSDVLCENERHFISVLIALSGRHSSAAHAHALLMCEGTDPGSLLVAAQALATLIVSPVTSLTSATQVMPSMH